MAIDPDIFEDEDVKKILNYAIEVDDLIKEYKNDVIGLGVVDLNSLDSIINFKQVVDKKVSEEINYFPEAGLEIKEKLEEVSNSLENRLNEEAKKHSQNVRELWKAYENIKSGIRDKSDYQLLQTNLATELLILGKLARTENGKYQDEAGKGIQKCSELRKRIKKETSWRRYVSPKKVLAVAAGIGAIAFALYMVDDYKEKLPDHKQQTQKERSIHPNNNKNTEQEQSYNSQKERGAKEETKTRQDNSNKQAESTEALDRFLQRFEQNAPKENAPKEIPPTKKKACAPTPDVLNGIYQRSNASAVIYVDKGNNMTYAYERNGKGWDIKGKYRHTDGGGGSGPKQRTGDNKTPEGIFGIDYNYTKKINSNSRNPLYGSAKIGVNSNFDGILICGTDYEGRNNAIDQGRDVSNSGVILKNKDINNLYEIINNHKRSTFIVIEDESRPINVSNYTFS